MSSASRLGFVVVAEEMQDAVHDKMGEVVGEASCLRSSASRATVS